MHFGEHSSSDKTAALTQLSKPTNLNYNEYKASSNTAWRNICRLNQILQNFVQHKESLEISDADLYHFVFNQNMSIEIERQFNQLNMPSNITPYEVPSLYEEGSDTRNTTNLIHAKVDHYARMLQHRIQELAPLSPWFDQLTDRV